MRSAPATAIAADNDGGALLLQRLATGDHASADRKTIVLPAAGEIGHRL